MAYIKELEEMGVASLKIEGRMKRPEYVAAATSIYRRALDGGEVTQEMMDLLAFAFNRQGFTDGYYNSKKGADMFGIRDDKKENHDFLKQMRQTYEAVENGRVDVVFHAEIDAGGSALTVTDPEGRQCTVQGPIPEAARRLPLSEEVFVGQVVKTGGTPYNCVGATANIAEGLALSAASINAMRRDALDQLTAMRARRDTPVLRKPRKLPHRSGFHGAPALTVQITDVNQITAQLLKMNPAVLYVPMHLLMQNQKLCRQLIRRVNVAAVLPRICHDGEMERLSADLRSLRAQGVKAVLVGNLGLLPAAREARMQIHGDFGLNIYNSLATEVAKDLELISATLSFEMTMPQILGVGKAVPCEILAYGRLPLMVTENCLFQGRSGDCICQHGAVRLMDKTGADFPIIKDGASCRSVLLNGKKLYWLDRQDDLAKLGLWATRLYFTTENPKEVDQILDSYVRSAPFDPGACTRGLYLRGLE